MACHSTIQMYPFEAVYGRAPSTLLDYVGNESAIEVVYCLLSDLTQALSSLKENLQ